eukprot:gene41528-33645_t
MPAAPAGVPARGPRLCSPRRGAEADPRWARSPRCPPPPIVPGERRPCSHATAEWAAVSGDVGGEATHGAQ